MRASKLRPLTLYVAKMYDRRVRPVLLLDSRLWCRVLADEARPHEHVYVPAPDDERYSTTIDALTGERIGRLVAVPRLRAPQDDRELLGVLRAFRDVPRLLPLGEDPRKAAEMAALLAGQLPDPFELDALDEGRIRHGVEYGLPAVAERGGARDPHQKR